MLKAVNGPISIVTMVGPVGSGKSSLAGRALLDNPAAFEEAKSKEPDHFKENMLTWLFLSILTASMFNLIPKDFFNMALLSTHVNSN